MGNVYGIIVCGGSGSRINKELPKQLLDLRGESLIRHTVRQFVSWSGLDSLVLAANTQYIDKIKEEVKEFLRPNDMIVPGGESRHKSCLKGISALNYTNDDIIIFHDCARPFFLKSELQKVADLALQYGASTLSEKISETSVRAIDKKVESVLNREELYLIKTPQGLHTSLLELLLMQSQNNDGVEEPTDLCTWTMTVGVKPFLIHSNPYNIKITQENDFGIAENYFELFRKINKED